MGLLEGCVLMGKCGRILRCCVADKLEHLQCPLAWNLLQTQSAGSRASVRPALRWLGLRGASRLSENKAMRPPKCSQKVSMHGDSTGATKDLRCDRCGLSGPCATSAPST